MAYENKRLLPVHYRMIELVLEGYGAAEIAQAMGYSPQGVSSVMACAIFQDELSLQRARRQSVHLQAVASTVVEARDKLHGLAVKAVDRLQQTLNSTNENIALRSVTTILDRIDGLNIPEKEKTQPQIVSQDRLVLIIETMRERGLNPSKYIDGTISSAAKRAVSAVSAIEQTSEAA